MAIEPSGPDRNVNLLIVTTGLGIGGAETVVRDLAHSIDRRRFNLAICCLKVIGSVGEALAREGIDISVVPQPADGSVDYLTALKLRRVIRDKQIDVVHSHTTHAFVDGGLCRLMMPRLKVIHTFHFGNYPHVGRSTRLMEGTFARVADRLIAVGEAQRQQIAAAYRLRADRIGMIWNGVQPVVPDIDPSFRARVGGEGRLLVGTLATLIEQKGLYDLLAVARLTRDAGDRIRFVVVGEGHMRAELERRRHDLGLDDTVVFAGWVQNAAERVLPAFDVFFQPSLWEAMSIAVLEAMSAGKPIVATRVGDNPHVISDGQDGILVDPGDHAGMAGALTRLDADSALRQSLGEAAARKFTGRFTLDHMTRAYEALYLDVLGHRAQPAGR